MELEEIAREFRFFAGMCAGRAPLYEALAEGVSGDDSILSLARGGEPGHPPVNLLFGAVHYLLLNGAEHPLRRFYASVGGREEPAGAYPVFVDFCRRHADAIRELVRTRRVQTNEVGRSGLLLPALFLAWERGGRSPLYLIEVGASAGLNLLFDRYRYAYSDGRECGPASPAVIRTELRGPAACPVPPELPGIGGRVGIDLAPVDVTDPDAVRWMEALIWPDQVQRLDLLRAAAGLARKEPPRLVRGDALERVGELVNDAPATMPVCVFHSNAVYQMSEDWRTAFPARLAELGRDRDLMEVSLEWLGDDPGPRLELVGYRGGGRDAQSLADCDIHGAWMAWRGQR